MATIADTIHTKLADVCAHEITTGESAGITLTAAETADLLEYLAVQAKRRRRMTLAYRDASREGAEYRRKLGAITVTAGDAVTMLGNLRAQLRHPATQSRTNAHQLEGFADIAGRAAGKLAALLNEVRQ